MPVLVTGFRPFGGRSTNPSGRLARSVDGARVAGETIFGRELPVSYPEAVDATLELVSRLRPRVVLGLGLAARLRAPVVEAFATNAADPRVLEAAGDGSEGLLDPGGPPCLAATIDHAALAAALGCGGSTDAGRYVCNAWFYGVLRGAAGVPVGFVHLPPAGLRRRELLRGLEALVERAPVTEAAWGRAVPA